MQRLISVRFHAPRRQCAMPSRAVGSNGTRTRGHLKRTQRSRAGQALLAVMVATTLWAMPATAEGQIFVTNQQIGTVGEYTLTGAAVNPTLLSGLLDPSTVAVSGSNLLVANDHGGTIGKYTTSGAPISPSLISGLPDFSTRFSLAGTSLFVLNPYKDLFTHDQGKVGIYDTSGAAITPTLLSGLNSTSGIAVADGAMYITSGALGTVSKYTTAGALVNPSLIAGLSSPSGIAVSGDKLFIANFNGTIGEYTTSGAAVNPALITGLNGAENIAVLGDKLFVTNYNTGTVGEYTTAGVTVNPALITGLTGPVGIAVVPEPASGALAILGVVLLVAVRWRTPGCFPAAPGRGRSASGGLFNLSDAANA
jgi:hypothetical protein